MPKDAHELRACASSHPVRSQCPHTGTMTSDAFAVNLLQELQVDVQEISVNATARKIPNSITRWRWIIPFSNLLYLFLFVCWCLIFFSSDCRSNRSTEIINNSTCIPASFIHTACQSYLVSTSGNLDGSTGGRQELGLLLLLTGPHRTGPGEYPNTSNSSLISTQTKFAQQ